MRLGMNWRPIASRAEIEANLDEMDRLGIAAISAPRELWSGEWSIDECAAFGGVAREYGLTVIETFVGGNLCNPDPEIRGRAIDAIRGLLVRADAMQADTVTSVTGSLSGGPRQDGMITPHPDNWSPRAKAMVRENCERILDGLDLGHTTYSIEPFCAGFFHEPDEVDELLRSVGHPRLRLHLDQMNMHSLATYFSSSELIDRTFDLLSDLVVAVHAKDLLWSDERLFLFLEEVVPGHGVLDYPRFVRRLAELPADVGVMTEHWATTEEYLEAIDFIRATAAAEGVEFQPRGPRSWVP